LENHLYIDCLKKYSLILKGLIRLSTNRCIETRRRLHYQRWIFIDRLLRKRNLVHVPRVTNFNVENRIEGLDWPAYADTMIGIKRRDNIEYVVKEILNNNIPGHFIETGVWRGGRLLFSLKALLMVNSYK